MTSTLEEKTATRDLVDMCRVYLKDNFHKFTEANKIRVAMALVLKAMPTTVEGDALLNQIINIASNGKSEGLLNRLECKPEEVSGTVSI